MIVQKIHLGISITIVILLSSAKKIQVTFDVLTNPFQLYIKRFRI
jgi:hypothetical protein